MSPNHLLQKDGFPMLIDLLLIKMIPFLNVANNISLLVSQKAHLHTVGPEKLDI